MAAKVGVIGLGQMGGAISANLVKNGFAVSGFDISAAARDNLASNGGTAMDSTGAVAAASDAMVLSLPSPAALDAVSDEIVGAGSAGLICAEISTLTIGDKQRAHDRLAEAGITLLDVPMSGTGVQARTGDLVYFASGDAAAIETAKPVLEGCCRDGYNVGAFGDGSKMKFVANLLVAIHNVAAGEALTLGRKAGLDPQLMLDVIGASAATSMMFKVRGPVMAGGDYSDAGMSVRLFQKDMGIIGDFARELGVGAPMFDASAKIHDAAMEQGHAEEDTASVCAVLERIAGLRD